MAELIKQFLQHYLSEKNNWKAILLQNWPTIIGNLRDRVTLEKIHDDLLVLGVCDSSWMQELYLLSPVILQTINASLDQPRIKRLRFKQIGRKKEINKKQKKQQQKKQISIELTKKEKTALETIDDQQLKKALKRFLVRCYQEKL